MIGHLRGTPLALRPELVMLDVAGVGYAVHIPLSTYYELERRERDRPASLHVYTHVREGEIALFGFWTQREKALFERLIAVSGIGPRLALVILSGLPPEELTSALAAGDAARLTAIPGVGKKTAERMVLELRERMAELVAAEPAARPAADQDVVSALVNLGYKRGQAERMVSETRREEPDAEFHDLLRSTLKRLSRA